MTIADAEEEAFVRALHPGRTWLGGTDAAHEGRFVWITGEPFAYQTFAPNEPDGVTLESNCLASDVDARWHDRSCGNLYRAVCEVD